MSSEEIPDRTNEGSLRQVDEPVAQPADMKQLKELEANSTAKCDLMAIFFAATIQSPAAKPEANSGASEAAPNS
jgi:hypothetical protein